MLLFKFQNRHSYNLVINAFPLEKWGKTPNQTWENKEIRFYLHEGFEAEDCVRYDSAGLDTFHVNPNASS